ncbi:MAG: 5-keto-4-deoxy-D-glucarate aldolase [Pirellulaceae bacterium]|nr:MAG: 5-keto-4-deoxy-D-glucarate aldolase [Pirellulaceae bacterium]
MVTWIDKKRLRQQVLAGTFLNLGSPTAVEIAAGLGFDWLLIDLEHGSGSWGDLRSLLLACHGASCSPIVRIRSIDPDVVKFVLDSGAAGIMFPFVSTAEAAQAAVQACKYPPWGNRGVAHVIRATDYGGNWRSYFETANENGLVVVQIETPEGVNNAEEIAAIDGVDVLFVGPLDLSVNLGCPGDFSSSPFTQSLRQVIDAAEKHQKAAGILSRPEGIDHHREMGFRFLALGSDAGAVRAGLAEALHRIRGPR